MVYMGVKNMWKKFQKFGKAFRKPIHSGVFLDFSLDWTGLSPPFQEMARRKHSFSPEMFPNDYPEFFLYTWQQCRGVAKQRRIRP